MNFGTDNALLKLKIFENAESFFERQYPPDTDIIVGRNEQSDLVLTSRRTSKRHCRIYFSDGQWQIEDLGSQNGTLVNGARVQTAPLTDGDVVQVGDYRIELDWKPVTASAPANDDDDRTVVISQDEGDDRTIIRPQAPAPSGQTGGDGPLDRIRELVLAHKIAAGVIGAVFLFFFMIAVFTPSSDTDETKPAVAPGPAGSEQTAAAPDLETQGRIDAYLQSGREALENGSYGQALVRFQAVLELDPQNQSARSYLVDVRQKMTEAEKLRRQAEEEERQKRQRAETIAARARQAMAADDFLKARDIIAEAVFLAPDNPDIVELQADIEAGLSDQAAARQQAEARRQEQLAELKQHFEQGQQFYDRENYREALKEWEALLAMDIDAPETAHTRHAIVHLRKLLEADIQNDYDRAVRLFKAGQSTRALVALNDLSQIAPDFRDTRQMLGEVLTEVEAEARRLYQEGLVYEGLGQHDKAMAKWREVLKAMPLKDNEYHQRAQKKLE